MKLAVAISCLLLPLCVFARKRDIVYSQSPAKVASRDTGQRIGALLVVDGIPYRGNLKKIDPNTIQDIDILKQPAAIALYGDQGKNGAILITTKEGVVRIYKAKLGMVSLSYHDYLASHQNDDKEFAYVLDGVLLGNNAYERGRKLYRIPLEKIASVSFKLNSSYNGSNKKAVVIITTKK